jgi:hypothetical protein
MKHPLTRVASQRRSELSTRLLRELHAISGAAHAGTTVRGGTGAAVIFVPLAPTRDSRGGPMGSRSHSRGFDAAGTTIGASTGTETRAPSAPFQPLMVLPPSPHTRGSPTIGPATAGTESLILGTAVTPGGKAVRFRRSDAGCSSRVTGDLS